MRDTKRAKLEAAGWKTGDARDFLELTDQEAAFVDMKLALAYYLRDLRHARGLTQSQLATTLGTSQSRVAKMEAADGTVSIDLLVKSLLAIGATRAEVGAAVAGTQARS